MSILIDLIVVAVIGIFVFISAKKGFVKTLIETVGFIAAIVIAFSVSGTVSEWAYTSYVEPAVVQAVEDKINSAVEEQKEKLPEGAQISVGIEDLPDYIVENAEKLGVSLEAFEARGEEAVAESIETAKETAVSIVKPIATKVVAIIAFIVLAIVLIIVFKFLAKVLNKLFSFSIIGVANRVLGGVLGGVKGVVIVTIVCTVLAFIAGVSGGFLIFTDDVINGTLLFKALANILSF